MEVAGHPRPHNHTKFGSIRGVIPNERHIRGDPRPFMTTNVMGTMAETLFDSGATHSAITAEIGRRIINSGIRLETSDCNITDVQGHQLKVLGSVTITITVNHKTILWSFLVIDLLAEECIIGSDFMLSNNMSINFGARCVFFNSDQLESLSLKRISPVHRTFIPENHHVKVRCNIDCPTILNPGSLVITKRSEIMEGVILEETLSEVMRSNRIFVVITNTNPFPICLKPTHSVGEITNTSGIKVIPVDEARISSFGNPAQTGPVAAATPEKMQYLKENFRCPQGTHPNIQAQYEELILANHDVFAKDKFDLGFSDKVTHKINMKTPQPVYVKQFRIPEAYESVILDHVTEWQKQHVIEECSSPYNSPVFCVPKKDGGLRIVQDLRQINKNSYIDKYAIKDVQECVDVIGKSNARIFSTMDMASGFWQQNLDEGSRDYTAFTIPLLNTQFRWKRNVMGLQGAPASFSRLTALVFRGIDNAITYIDDLLTHSQTHAEQLNILQLCFDRMRSFTMKFNIKKCVFGATSVTYLGFQISEAGVAPANDKVIAVRSFTPPTNLKEVRAFIGFCNYFRRMVPNFSRRAGPLISMTKLNSGWKSGPLPKEALGSFEDMKQALSSCPVVGYSRTGGQYVLTVDAATSGLGAILSQVNSNEETIVSYWSRTVREHERNYTPYMLEMTAVCSAVEHFHEYIFGKKIIVYTDHRPLIGASTMQKKTINRLVENMNVYNIDLRYKKGTDNQGADYLSRNTVMSISQQDRFNDIRTHQSNDNLICNISNYLKHNALPVEDSIRKVVLHYSPRCFLKDNLLWYVAPKTSFSKAVLFTPMGMIPTVISNAHGTLLSGHWAVARTIARLSESYFWPSMSQDVVKFISTCDSCQRAQRPPKKAELTPWPACNKPNERVHIDLFGPLRGNDRYKYVAVMSCAFSKWVEVVPLENKEAPTVAKAIFEQWICRRGVMHQLVSDGGKEFANTLLDELCKLMSTDKHVVTAYHPMANGQVERFNRDMKKYLKTMLEDTTNWVEFLKPLQFAHNTAVSSSTNFTPHFLTFLDHPRLPDTVSEPENVNAHSYSSDAFRRMQYAYKLVFKNNEVARQTYTKYFNQKARDRNFAVGDEVLASFPVQQSVPNKKLASIWKGPYAIIELCENNIVIIKASPQSKAIRLHSNRIVLFNHLADSAVEPQPQSQPAAATTPTPPEEEEDDDIFDLQPLRVPPVILRRHEGQYQVINPLVDQPPIPVLQPPPPPQAVPRRPLDQLAVEIFRHTRSRGPAPEVPQTPHRPLEYTQRR